MEILMIIAQYLMPVIASILAVLLAAGTKKLMDKWGIERSEKIDYMIDTYVHKGINVADVAARKYFELNKSKLPGYSKRAKAVKTVMAELKQSGITGVAEELIIGRIESWLEVKGHNPGIPSNPESPGESA